VLPLANDTKVLHIALSSICTESQYANAVGIVVAV
jgi:hypothetical protein